MVCAEKTRLVSEYEAAAGKLSTAITDLHSNMGTSAKAEFDRLKRVVDVARAKFEVARLSLERHIAEHKMLT